MRILLGNNTLSLLAGSETWTEALAKQFKIMGHDVTAYSPNLCLIATKLEAVGIRCIDKLQSTGGTVASFDFTMQDNDAGGQYDVIVCNHYQITQDLHKAFPNTPIIATVHGILHKSPEGGIWPEHPVTEFKVDQYVSVSEEVQDVLKRDYGIESVVIRNFFDLERFKPSGKVKAKPESFLINTNYWGNNDPINEIIKEVGKHYGARIMAIGANFVGTYETEKVMEEADVVFGMGRSVMEGVCAGKLGICHGRWGTGGIITPETYDDMRRMNFSGRNSGGQFIKPEDVIKLIDSSFNQENIDKMLEIVKQDHNVVKAAEQYLQIASSLIKS